jgi:GNAT superfamily N-acetyltransferase
MTHEDISAGLRLCRLSFWNQVEDDWRCFLDSPGSGGWLAEKDGAVVGAVTFLRYGTAFGWLSMMLVDPQERRAGIGTLLMEAALDSAGKSCVRLDATPAGEPLYRRYGFVPEYELMRLAVTVSASRFPQPPRNVRPTERGDLPEVFAWDRKIFGADRSVLLASLYRRAPELAWVERDGGGIVGYSFGRPGYLYQQLGPIVGESSEIARGLVARCLSGQDGKQIAVDVPRFAPKWIEWLESMGFQIERPFVTMRRRASQ